MTAIAFVVTAALHPVVGEQLFFVPSLAAVVVAAWFAEIGAALWVVAATVLLNTYLFAHPAGSFYVTDSGDRLRLLVFAATGILLAFIVEACNRAVKAYTERREREADTLQDQAERLRLQAELLDHAYDAVFVRGEDDRITYWNTACVDLYGWTAPEALGRNAHALLGTRFPLSLDQFNDTLRREGHWSGELVHTTRDGRSVAVDSRQVLVPGDGAGRTHILEINRDITGQKLARQRETMLLEASSLLSSSLDSDRVLGQLTRLVVPALADWCVIDLLEADGRVRRVAGSHRDPTRQDLVDRLIRIVPNERTPSAEAMRTGGVVAAPAMDPAYADSMARDEEHRAIIRGLKAGSYMAVPLFARGRIVGAITFVYAESRRVYDGEARLLAEAVARRAGLAIDNARLYQEAHEANRLKDEFLATLSHELRTPLNAIRGWTQMLLAGKLDANTVRRAYETIDRNAQAQTQLITDILDVSRIITGKLRLHITGIDLAEIVETSVDGVRPAAEAKRLQLDAVYEVRPARMLGDRDRLQQILWNLLSNAVKFTPSGGRIEVRLAAVDSRLQVRVTDTGVGVRRDFLPHMFERFTQSDASASRAYGGLGLGLAISRHLAELHGGTIVADSAGEGQGATFTVTLPVRAVAAVGAADPGRRADARETSAWPVLEGVTVLVVDDETDARELMTTVLRRQGAAVLAAASADEARNLLQRERPHVIVSDIGMPGEDGYAFIRTVRTLAAEMGGETPAIAVTAYARGEDRLRALAAGYQEHVAKPVVPADLIAVVADVARPLSRPVAD